MTVSSTTTTSAVSSSHNASADASSSYRIERGDTLSGIASAHGTTVDALMRANPQIHDADRIYAGDDINLPPEASDAGAADEAPSMITVHTGDTLSRLAREYDTDVATLARLNGISDPNLIHVGDRLRLPGQSSSDTPTSVPVTTPIVASTPAGAPQRGITEAQYAAVASALGVDVAAIKAVAEVEASGDGLLASGKPKVLFEAHVFHRLTDGRYDSTQPKLSSPHWNRSLYGAGGEHQWDRLDQARALDENAALQSASWGRFQIMGFNSQKAGFDSLSSFVTAMKSGEGEHLRAFANFIQSDSTMLTALRNHDWANFALRYNGEGYAANQYDTKMAEAYARYAH